MIQPHLPLLPKQSNANATDAIDEVDFNLPLYTSDMTN